jgi:hypothetical protein
MGHPGYQRPESLHFLGLLQLLLAFAQCLMVKPLTGLQLFYLLSQPGQFLDELFSVFVLFVHRN